VFEKVPVAPEAGAFSRGAKRSLPAAGALGLPLCFSDNPAPKTVEGVGTDSAFAAFRFHDAARLPHHHTRGRPDPGHNALLRARPLPRLRRLRMAFLISAKRSLPAGRTILNRWKEGNRERGLLRGSHETSFLDCRWPSPIRTVTERDQRPVEPSKIVPAPEPLAPQQAAHQRKVDGSPARD
jgi:hypothetical protein